MNEVREVCPTDILKRHCKYAINGECTATLQQDLDECFLNDDEDREALRIAIKEGWDVDATD